MKPIKTFTIMAAMLLAASFTVFAGEEKQETEKETPKELKNQTLCPVMGGKIDSTVFTDIQGQRVYHCCPGCSAPLKKDPDKYFKKAAEDGVLFENIQTTCPVSGEKLENKSAYTDFEGRRIVFCCEKCIAAFNKEPQKFLSKMDAPATEEKGHDGDDHSKHEGHNH